MKWEAFFVSNVTVNKHCFAVEKKNEKENSPTCCAAVCCSDKQTNKLGGEFHFQFKHSF